MGEGHFEADNALSGAGIGVCRGVKGVEKSGQPRFSTAKRTLDAPAARFILPAGALSCAWFQPKLVVLGQIDRLLTEFGQVHQARPFGQIEIRRG